MPAALHAHPVRRASEGGSGSVMRKSLEHTERRLSARIDRAHASGREEELAKALAVYCDAYSAHFVAACWLKENRSRQIIRNAHLPVEELAQRSLTWDIDDERVTVEYQGLRSDWSARLIFNAGAINRTRQLVVKHALYRSYRIHNDQALLNGGQTAAIRRVIANYKDGYHHVAEVDVTRCYQSFDRSRTGRYFGLSEKVTALLGVQDLKLWPSQYIRKEWLHLSGSEDRECVMDLFRHRFDEEFATAQSGLTEGSMVSPYLVEMMLAPVCASLRESGLGRAVCYADNFLLMARTSQELLAMERRLREELRAHPVGAHEVHTDRVPCQTSDFAFIGYRLEPDGRRLIPHAGPKVLKNASELRRQAHRILNSSMPWPRKRQILRETVKRHWSIINSIRLWERRESYHREKMEPLNALLHSTDTRVDTREVRPTRRYRPRPLSEG